MFGSVNRITPQLPPGAMSTYRVAVPLATHWRQATCEEVECPAMVHGWRTILDEQSDRGAAQAHYIRRESGRMFTEQKNEAGLTVFTFSAGQPCFGQASHRVRIERPEIYLRLGGDWRGNPNRVQPYRHVRPSEWVEDMNQNQERIIERRNRG